MSRQICDSTLFLIKALPGFIMMYPTTALISYFAEKERIKCKKASKVK
jgi:hypothetical protein